MLCDWRDDKLIYLDIISSERAIEAWILAHQLANLLDLQKHEWVIQ